MIGQSDGQQPGPPSRVGAVQRGRGDDDAAATAMGASSERYRQMARATIAAAVSGGGFRVEEHRRLEAVAAELAGVTAELASGEGGWSWPLPVDPGGSWPWAWSSSRR